MKIIYVLNSGIYGGMERHVLDLVEGMISKGHEVFVWCPDGVVARDCETFGAEVTRKEITLDIDPIYIFKLARFLKKNEIDVIHAHELKASTNALLAGKVADTKSRISHTHTPISEWQISNVKKKINLFVYPRIINAFSTYEIALTESRKMIKVSEGVEKEKLYIVKNPNAIKVENFTIDQKKKSNYRKVILKRHSLKEDNIIWGCLGRISEEKGHHILMEAFNLFVKNIPDKEKNKHHLMFIGGGHLEDHFLEKSENMDIQDQFTITGRFLDEDKIKYYSSLDYFVHPSLAEGFGIVLVEAMTVGLPVIASDLEVFKEVAGDTVHYFKTGDAESLSRVMQKTHSQRDEEGDLIQKAQQRAIQNYSYEKFVNSYHQFYLELQQK